MSFKTWTEEHKTLWQFIKFNVLSNISTITRFVCTWVGTAIFINAMQLNSPSSCCLTTPLPARTTWAASSRSSSPRCWRRS